jgi:hypothetical protein
MDHSDVDSFSYAFLPLYEGVSKSFRTESITKYTLTTVNTRWEATQRVMAVKLTRMTHKIAIQLHLVPTSCTIYSSRPRRPVRKLLDTPSYVAAVLCQNRALMCVCLEAGILARRGLNMWSVVTFLHSYCVCVASWHEFHIEHESLTDQSNNRWFWGGKKHDTFLCSCKCSNL